MSTISKNSERILKLLPADGTPITNDSLRQQLHMTKEDFCEAREPLIQEGDAVKLRGRGGRTALTIGSDTPAEKNGTRALRLLAWVCYFIAGLTAVGVMFALVPIGGTGSHPDVALDLFFGLIGIAAVGISLQIYVVQTESERKRAHADGRVQESLLTLTRQSAYSSASAADGMARLWPALQPALDTIEQMKIDSSNENAATPGAKQTPDDSPIYDSDANIRSTKTGQYFLPPSIPLKVISDLVQWWKEQGETGSWTLSRLVGGYRPFNKGGNFAGVPWILTFDDNDDENEYRSYRLSYSGRQQGPAVSRLQNGVWHDVDEGI